MGSWQMLFFKNTTKLVLMRFEPAADSLLHHKVKEPLETKEKQKSSTKENVENEVLHWKIVEQLIEDEEDFVCAGTKLLRSQQPNEWFCTHHNRESQISLLMTCDKMSLFWGPQKFPLAYLRVIFTLDLQYSSVSAIKKLNVTKVGKRNKWYHNKLKECLRKLRNAGNDFYFGAM